MKKGKKRSFFLCCGAKKAREYPSLFCLILFVVGGITHPNLYLRSHVASLARLCGSDSTKIDTRTSWCLLPPRRPLSQARAVVAVVAMPALSLAKDTRA